MGHWDKKREKWQFESGWHDRDSMRDEAFQALRADYYTDVTRVGEDLVERVEAGEITDPEGFDEAMHEDIDGNRRVFITFLAKSGLLASDNESAAEEEGIETEGPEQQMYFAMRRDVQEWLDANDHDWQDEDWYDEED